jgi:uncharacterized membrane protein YbhN (UPF0104 family)
VEFERLSAHPSRRKAWLWLALKLLIVAMVFWGVQRTLFTALEEVGQQQWRLQPGWLVLSGLLYLAGLAPSGWFWHRLLCELGASPTLGQTLRSYYIGHLGKYVPGKAMVIVLRAGLLRGQKVDAVLASATIFLETLTSMAVGALLAAAVIAVWFRENWPLVLAALAMAAVTGLPVWPPLFRRLAQLLRLGKSNPELIERLARINYRTLLAGWLAIAAGWFLIGLSLWAARRAIGLESTDFLPDGARYTAAVSLATVAGFLSFIPGGFGVRDAVLMEVLALGFAQDAAATALVSAVLLRLVWLVAELAISGILYGLKGNAPPPLAA